MAQIHVHDNGQELSGPFLVQNVEVFQVDCVVIIIKRRIVVVGEKIPAFIIHQGKIDGDKGVVPQRTFIVDCGGSLFFSRALLPENHNGMLGLGHLDNGVSQRPDGPCDAEKAVEKAVFHVDAVQVLNPVFAGGEGNLAVRKLEHRIIVPAEGNKAAGNRIQSSVNVFKAFMRRFGGGGQILFQRLNHRIFFVFRERGVKNLPLAVKDNGGLAAGADDLAEKPVFFPHIGVAGAQLHRLIEGAADTLIAGRDQNCVQAQALRSGAGNHIAQDHAVAPLFQHLKRFLHLSGIVDCKGLHLILEQIAEQFGAADNAWKAYDGIVGGKIFRHFDGTENIVDRQGNLHHRNGGDLSDQLRSTAAGNDNIVIVVKASLGNFCSLLQVAHIDGQINIVPGLGRLQHNRTHPLVGCDPQNPYFFIAHVSFLPDWRCQRLLYLFQCETSSL